VTQVSRGNRPGVALPIRIHELLLGLAGRLDDDALADARQMLASAELDRSLEFVAGCLAAGGVVLSGTQHKELEELFASTYLDPSVVERMPARDDVPAYRHRFAVGAVNGIEPDYGVPETIRPVLDVLPDVRSVWCVWRLTPAGPVSGPVPHRVVLVGVGPGGFAPATAYRVEYALRRAGVRASVEVLVDGGQQTDYHQEAMRCARQVPFDDPGPGGGGRPLMSPAEPVRAEAFTGDPATATLPPRATTTALADGAAPATAMLATPVSAAPSETSDAVAPAVAPAASADVPMTSSAPTPTAPTPLATMPFTAPATQAVPQTPVSEASTATPLTAQSAHEAPTALATSETEATAGSVTPTGSPSEVAEESPDAHDAPTVSAAETAETAETAEAKPADDAVPVAASMADVAEVRAAPEAAPVSPVSDAPAAQTAQAASMASSPETVPAVSSADDGPAEDSAPAPTAAESGLLAETPLDDPTPADSDGPAAENAPPPASTALATGDVGPAMAAVDPILPIVATATPAPPATETTPEAKPEAKPLATFPVAGLAVDPPVDSPADSPSDPPADPPAENRSGVSATRSAFGVEPPTLDSVRPNPETPLRLTRPRPVESIKSVFEEGADEEPVAFKPSPRRRHRTQDEPPARPRLVPAAPADDLPTDRDGHAAALIDDMLNTQERHLLRELQEELARRENQGNQSGPWRSGRHGKSSPPFEPGQAAVNGPPPRHDRGRGSA
jgi:hypothetical protein